jgi:hypothetical protein
MKCNSLKTPRLKADQGLRLSRRGRCDEPAAMNGSLAPLKLKERDVGFLKIDGH